MEELLSTYMVHVMSETEKYNVTLEKILYQQDMSRILTSLVLLHHQIKDQEVLNFM